MQLVSSQPCWRGSRAVQSPAISTSTRPSSEASAKSGKKSRSSARSDRGRALDSPAGAESSEIALQPRLELAVVRARHGVGHAGSARRRRGIEADSARSVGHVRTELQGTAIEAKRAGTHLRTSKRGVCQAVIA